MDSDDEDLFADFENEDDLTNANVSANLIDDVGLEHVAAREESADDGKRIGWVAPAASGLKNSTTLSAKAVNHWYHDIKNKPDTNKASPGGRTTAPPANSTGVTGLWRAPEEAMRTKPREELRQQLAAHRELAASSNGHLTHDHMKNGIDEDGNRVRIFSSALTSERCIKVRASRREVGPSANNSRPRRTHRSLLTPMLSTDGLLHQGRAREIPLQRRRDGDKQGPESDAREQPQADRRAPRPRRVPVRQVCHTEAKTSATVAAAAARL